MQTNNRKSILINRNFQFRFVLYTFLPVLISQIVLWAALEIYINKMIQKGVQANLPSDHFYFRLMAEQLGLMKMLFVSVGAISFLIIVVWALFISHKIAGPFYRLTRMLKSNDDSLKTFKFRPGDFFPEVAEAVSEYARGRKAE
jgi:sensor histidine kinase YesM